MRDVGEACLKCFRFPAACNMTTERIYMETRVYVLEWASEIRWELSPVYIVVIKKKKNLKKY